MTEKYDESLALQEYLTRNFRELMTDQERLAYDLALKHEKAKRSSVAAKRLTEGNAHADSNVRKMASEGAHYVGKTFRKRIQDEVWTGRIQVNRCPACSRIVKTPKARQCLWCGHDWRSA